MQEMSLVFCCW